MSVWNLDTRKQILTTTPFSIVNGYCKELYEMTEGRLIARVTEYDGPYQSTPSHANTDTDYQTKAGFNAQSVMGESASDGQNNTLVYEFYVTSKNTPKYKYRVFIMYHSVTLYPVGLTIQKDIADEINYPAENVKCATEEEFRMDVERILGSRTLGDVLSNLLALNQRSIPKEDDTDLPF